MKFKKVITKHADKCENMIHNKRKMNQFWEIEKWQINRQGHEQCYYKRYSYAKDIKENKYDERRIKYIYHKCNL